MIKFVILVPCLICLLVSQLAAAEITCIALKLSEYGKNAGYATLEIIILESLVASKEYSVALQNRETLDQEFGALKLPPSENSGSIRISLGNMAWTRVFFVIPIGRFQYETQQGTRTDKIQGELKQDADRIFSIDFDYQRTLCLNPQTQHEKIIGLRQTSHKSSDKYQLMSMSVSSRE